MKVGVLAAAATLSHTVYFFCCCSSLMRFRNSYLLSPSCRCGLTGSTTSRVPCSRAQNATSRWAFWIYIHVCRVDSLSSRRSFLNRSGNALYIDRQRYGRSRGICWCRRRILSRILPCRLRFDDLESGGRLRTELITE